MSTLYNLEPQPTAKAVLHTTSGDISLELFAQQTPLTSRNFLQLCLDGYYDNTIFHRVVPGFIIQGGDPTGTGSGGQSSLENGASLEDEFHNRLKFNRRGLLGMANSGSRDDNGSQFFLTLGKTEELTGRNTMFGRVEGNTVFNLVKMGEADLADGEGSERPLYPTMITGTEVLVNPFKDMVRRVKAVETRQEEVRAKKKPGVKKKAAKTLLSFGGGEGEDDAAAPVIKAAKFNTKLVNADFTSGPPTKPPAPVLERAPKRRLSRSPSPPTAPPTRTAARNVKPPSPTPSRSPSPFPQPQATNALSTTLSEIAALKSSLKRNIATPNATSAKPKSALDAMIPTTATRGRKRKAGTTGGAGRPPTREEQRALDAFKAFKRKLDDAVEVESVVGANAKDDVVEASNGGAALPTAPLDDAADDDEAVLCDLHFIANCQSCTNWDDAGDSKTEDAAADGDIFGHRLTFEKDRLGKDLAWKRANEDDLVVIDPREKEREIVGEKKRRDKERAAAAGGMR